MPGKGFCAKNMAVIIAMSDILQLQDGHCIRFYKFPKIKNSAKNRSLIYEMQVWRTQLTLAAHHLRNAALVAQKSAKQKQPVRGKL